ncbi:NfeD family protein [Algivirga pacifica]|uniref:NfeD-like C-terminal domain-containing protein n=1 Tax=Algivirga pacifica TaxID=1162670 RepID=A0ABP9D448_9BACT
MGDWIMVLSLLGFGVILLLVEFFLIPGTTIAGVLGFLAALSGIYMGYEFFGAMTGHMILAGTLVVTLAAFIQSFRSNTWNQLALKKSIDSKVNEDDLPLEVGDIGLTVSALRPSGSANFDGDIREVCTFGQFVNTNTSVRVTRVEGVKIYVEEV